MADETITAEDPWAAFEPRSAPAAAADPWAEFTPRAVPTQEAAGDDAGPWGNSSDLVPEAFMLRTRRGQAISEAIGRVMAAAGREGKEGFAGQTSTGFQDETLNLLIENGIFHDPAKGSGGPIHMVNEATLMPIAQGWQALIGTLAAGVHGAGGAVGQLVEELGGSQGTANRAKNETINAANWAMIEGGFGRFSRASIAKDVQALDAARNAGIDGAVSRVLDETIGGLPTAVDFANASKVLDSPHAELNLKRIWQEDGIHPAEAVADAANDAFLRHDLTAPRIEVKLEPAELEMLTETGGRPGSLSAARTEPGDIPLEVQPASPPGSLSASIKTAADSLLDIGRDVQMLVVPMARGTTDSMAIAKDFANGLRRNRWDWDRIDTDIAKRFTPEQRARMWTAADEESVSLQLKEPAAMREHQGLTTLEPAERAAVEELQTRAQNAWLRAADLGMVKGEGLPSYTPRMVINIAGAGPTEGALALNVIGSNLKTQTANMLKRRYLEAQDTEAAARARFGDQAMLARDIRVLPMATAHLEDAIAGRTLINNIKEYGARTGADTVVEGAIPVGSETKWFTMDHPAFRTWRPRFEKDASGNLVVDAGATKIMKDADGNVIFERVPIFIHGDFEGPLRAVLSHKSGKAYGAAMALKAKTMSVIMNSPMIHNAVEWGRALPAMPGKVATFKVYFEGNRAKHDVAIMHEAIDNGLVPIGHRFFNQDINGLMEAPDLTPGRSWTSKILAAVPGLFDEAAGITVKRAIDKAGDFWHNTLLWDRVADLQMGLYVNMRADAIAKGIDPQTASRMAAHWANRYAGALPKEAMSDGATKAANMLMFSRSFTVGNWGVMKDALTGLPKDVLAQIKRDMGEVDPKAVGYAKAMARRKAMSVVIADMVLLYVGNTIMQSAFNVLANDATLEKELYGYVTRFQAKMQAIKEHPLELIQPMRLLEELGATADNEPGRKEKIHVGYAANGTAIYMRQPAGKIGEEFLGYMTGPLDMMRKKMSTTARPAWQIMNNDAGFGRKIYDPDAHTPAAYLLNLGRIAAHLAKAQTPEGQIGAFADLVRGEGDAKVNALQSFGPFAGVTFSKGAPGGMAVGEMYTARNQHQFKVNQALPDIRRQIQRGDIEGARERMTELNIPIRLQRFYERTTLNPALRLTPRAVHDFGRQATPEAIERFERARSR